MQPVTSNNYAEIFLSNSDLLDVRAPVEFKQGAFPTAANLPLLNDDERTRVGLCYKHQGQQKAIELGHALVSGITRQQRIDQWIDFAKQHQNSYLYCFRGGLRSRISQQWLAEAGIEITRIEGGYKALRHYLVRQLETADKQFEFTLIGGLTGCRKTELVRKLKHGIDLEGSAHHRGSSFGAHALPQSSQINFENSVAIDFLKAGQCNLRNIALEDEGRFIGSVDIPKNIFTKMRASPIVVVERKLQERLQQLITEYIVNMEAEFLAIHQGQETAFHSLSQYLLDSLHRIQKRLGMQKWESLHTNMQSALKTHQSCGDYSAHLSWLEPLLVEYYDPMYESQLNNRKQYIVFKGNYTDCEQYLNDRV